MTAKKYQIQVSDIRVDVIKKDIKNMYLRVYPPDGNVRLSAPKTISDESVNRFIHSKMGWIQKKIKKVKDRPLKPKLTYVQGETHYLWGEKYLLNVMEKEAAPKAKIRENQILELSIRPGSTQSVREKVLREWYRELLKKEIPLLIKKWEPVLGVTVNDWGVKKMKTRWGTCNTRVGRIWLNLELAKKPKHLLDYVVLHEMVHLKERLHNDRFKSFLNQHMPDWKKREQELDGRLC